MLPEKNTWAEKARRLRNSPAAYAFSAANWGLLAGLWHSGLFWPATEFDRAVGWVCVGVALASLLQLLDALLNKDA